MDGCGLVWSSNRRITALRVNDVTEYFLLVHHASEEIKGLVVLVVVMINLILETCFLVAPNKDDVVHMKD